MLKKLILLIITIFMIACGGSSSSDSSEPPVVIINHEPTGSVTINGNTQVDDVLSITQNLADSDGLGALNYQWFRTNNNVADVINNEISINYTLTSDDIGYAISATVSYTDGSGFAESVSSALSAVVVVADDVNKPNILLIIADDQGLDASAQYDFSTDVPNTPVIDALAMQGIVFDNAWATPACTTTRGTLITGQHGINSGISYVPAVLDTDATTLQGYLKSLPDSSDYQTAVVGKWHLGGGNPELSHPLDSGVDYYAGTIKGTLDSYYDWPLTINGQNTNSTEYHTTKITNLAIDWLAQQNQADTPWFMWLAYVAPHSPFHLPPENLHQRDHLTGTDADINANKREYYLAAIEAMDSEIGRLLESLPEDELANTLIIYIGDNGTPAAVIDASVYEKTHSKGSLYEGGIRIPMVVAGKGVSRNNVHESALVNTTDFYATISQFTGNTISKMNDSYSFLSLLSQENTGLRNYNYAEFESSDVTGWTVRDPEHKLIEFSDGSQELYVLSNSTNDEQANLVAENDNLLENDGNSDTSTIVNTLRTQALLIRNESNESGIDITNSILTTRSANCADYVESYQSTVLDVNNNQIFNGELAIAVADGKCIFQTNNIPNHDFNDGGQAFPNHVSAQSIRFEVSATPSHAANITDITLTLDNAILLNGVKVDLLAAACFGVGDGKVGCNDINQAWRYDPMFSANGFRVDSHNAHSQPDGSYHYHGKPNALYHDDSASAVSPVVGFAADGYPIFGPYFDDNGTIRKVLSSYQLHSGSRPTGNGSPEGAYDGTYRDDYQYVEQYGDLDECNGMTIDGVYGYYITDGFPYVLTCFKGTPDSSFNK
jgi:arylsulfatase A-like enzyme